MAAFASFCIQSNFSTVNPPTSAHYPKSLKSSIPSFNKRMIKIGPNSGKKYVPVSMSIRLEEGEDRGGGGAGLLEREIEFPKIPAPVPLLEPDAGGQSGKVSDKWGSGGGERYKVLLLDHERHTEKQVAAVLPKVVPSVTAEEAKKCFHESRKTGESLVTVAVKEHAEFYAQMMARSGLRSAIEPDGDVL